MSFSIPPPQQSSSAQVNVKKMDKENQQNKVEYIVT